MGFLAGRMSFDRFRIVSPKVRKFGPEHVEILEQYAISQVEATSASEASLGFLAGSHLLDEDFRPEKNMLAHALHFGIRIDTNKVPAALRKAWLEMELAATAADNPSGKANRAQRKQAKEAVETRCEEEAASGKYRRMQQFPVLWDARPGVLYLGSSGSAAGEPCLALLAQAFDLSLERLTAGRLADQWAENNKHAGELENVVPSVFHADEPEAQIAWLRGSSGNLDFLGNEFLVWLWWSLETNSDAIALGDKSEVVGMLNRTLSLECPRAESGKETITAESPVRLPEAMRAISSGKLPRKSGLLLVRQGVQHEFVLQAETLAVGGAKIQLAESGNSADTGEDDDRIEGLRHLSETIDLLFGAFCQQRLTKAWTRELEQIRTWLGKSSPASKKKSAA